MIQFDLPKDQSSIIKVIGVGGGGSNAVNHMYDLNIEGVDFIICNTDAQAIAQSNIPNKIQLGPHLTQGLGAGANPNIGRQATEESLEEIRRILEVNTKMAFITAGMGGGTGTGGAPILAKICKDLGILTVGIVTTPFSYEGRKRIAQAEEGIQSLKNHVDTLLVISNDKLRQQFGNLKMREAFGMADNVLSTAAKCITDVINSTGQINVDFADVCTVMRNGGVAILGSAAESGENRAEQAILNALNSPLLNDNDIRGAKWILININSAEGEFEHTMDEVETIQEYIISQAGENTDVILGLGYDNTLGDKIGITLIATGFEHKDPFKVPVGKKEEKEKAEKVVMNLRTETPAEPKIIPVVTPENPKAEVPEVAKEAEPIQFIPPQEPVLPQALMPTILGETTEELTSEMPVKEEPAKEVVEMMQPAKPDMITFDFSEAAEEPRAKEEPREQVEKQGFLSKPTQIYAENKPAAAAPKEEPIIKKQDEVEPLELFVKQEPAKPADPLGDYITKVAMAAPQPENVIPDETEELRKRAAERIARLRNLSYNLNDPNSDYEMVPAYMRRDRELHNQIANVESFYSNYSVKSNENNQVELSTINTYLDGKKPD